MLARLLPPWLQPTSSRSTHLLTPGPPPLPAFHLPTPAAPSVLTTPVRSSPSPSSTLRLPLPQDGRPSTCSGLYLCTSDKPYCRPPLCRPDLRSTIVPSPLDYIPTAHYPPKHPPAPPPLSSTSLYALTSRPPPPTSCAAPTRACTQWPEQTQTRNLSRKPQQSTHTTQRRVHTHAHR